MSRLRSLLLAPVRPPLARVRAYLNAPVLDAVGRMAAPEPTAAPAPLDVSRLLHDCRSAYLRAMPPGAQTLLSAGCSGLWYFDWVRRSYGPVRQHIGLEYYTPKPEGLPAGVEWIGNTVSDMSGVGDASCDLVFSGQNLEHLWPEEVAGFFAEASRVTRPGGWLVIDSPNRLLTAPLNWSHPEHTVELTVDEARALVELAGFDVTKVGGIWLCRDPRTGRVLPFDPNVADADWTLHERVLAARDEPQNSFIWWIEGRRSARAPDVAALEARMQDIFAAAWPERAGRLLIGVGTAVQRHDEAWVLALAGESGALLYGPYMPLKAGAYRATFMVDVPSDTQAQVGRCEVITSTEAAAPLASAPIFANRAAGGPQTIALAFTLDQLQFGLQFRCISDGATAISVRRAVELDRTS